MSLLFTLTYAMPASSGCFFRQAPMHPVAISSLGIPASTSFFFLMPEHLGQSFTRAFDIWTSRSR